MPSSFILIFMRTGEGVGIWQVCRELGVDESQVIKTIVMEDDGKSAFIVLMHGNREISVKEMARHLQVKSVHPCDPHTVQKLTGYMVGGTSPFGTKRPLPVYMEKSIIDLPQIYINAGCRGLLTEMSPRDLERILKPNTVNVAR